MKAASLATILVLCVVATTSAPLTASNDRDRDDREPDKPYLALGDSVPFGLIPQFGFEAVNPANLVGYPDFVGRAVRLVTVNPSCPGETSFSFFSAFVLDLGCREYRSHLPLHVAYGGTQSEFAIRFVQANPETRLVTIQLGANDYFIARLRCGGVPDCISQVARQPLEDNILRLIGDLRAAGYRRQIVIVNYYPLDLNDGDTTFLIEDLNNALADAANLGGATVADVFTKFKDAITNDFARRSTCRAGLLKANPFDQQSCDIHPSQTGHRLIAAAFRAALSEAERHDH